MNQIRRFLIILFISIFCFRFAAEAQTTRRFVYQDQSRENTYQKEFVLTRIEQGYLLKVTTPGNQTEIQCDADFQTQAITLIPFQSPDRFSIKRKDDLLIFSGMREGKELFKMESIEKKPWYGLPFLFTGFVLSAKDSQEFFMASPEYQRHIKLKVIREEIEEIKVQDKTVKAVKVKLTLPDWRSAFWSSSFWFRASDGIWVKSEETRGFPGTPKTIVELVEESPQVW